MKTAHALMTGIETASLLVCKYQVYGVIFSQPKCKVNLQKSLSNVGNFTSSPNATLKSVHATRVMGTPLDLLPSRCALKLYLLHHQMRAFFVTHKNILLQHLIKLLLLLRDHSVNSSHACAILSGVQKHYPKSIA